MNKADAGAWAAVSKVPREHLARSLLLLQLCRDLRVQEHDETNRGIIHQFVDEACSHINTLAVNARQCKETPDGNYFQEEWDQIWKLVHDLGPSIHPPEIFQKVREAQQKDSVIKDKLIDISGKIQRFKARLTAKDITILVAGPKLGMTIHEHIKVKKRTPPRGLSAAIMFSKPDIVGKSFDLYPVDGWAPGQKPATWNDNEETPSHLFLISDRGHFRFRAPISTIWVDFSPFRNIVSFKRGSHTITFLKDCFGELREHPDKKVIDNRPVYCWRANQDTSTRVESWRELIAALVDHLDENWTIKDINLPPPPHAPFAILGTSTLSSLLSQADEDRDQDSSGTDRHPNKWSIGSWTSRGTNTSMYGSRLSAAGQDQPKGVSAGKMRLSPLVPFTEDSEAPLSDTSSSSRPTNPNRRTHARPIVMEHYSDSPISRPPSAFNSGLSNTMNVDPHKSAALVPSSATGALSIITAGAKEDEDYTGGIGEISTESSAVFHTIDAPSTAAIQQTRIGSSRGAHSMEAGFQRPFRSDT
ncbi:hypothetical protein FRB91_005298 [Serendipita sp. 411]|nr:hypothetical protein FRB91_005298 [Serendipita sp. 411]